jgi:predicted lactoylglutathione lyase
MSSGGRARPRLQSFTSILAQGEHAMSTTQAPAPTIRNAGFKPKSPHKLFVNIRVTDLQRSIEFFEALGFTFNTHFTDATATCMLVGEDAYFMLLTKEKFASFSKRPLGDPQQATGALYALGVESRAAVDEMVNAAIANGGSPALDPQDHGFMYGWSFYDPDGHHWEVFWMDPSVPVT